MNRLQSEQDFRELLEPLRQLPPAERGRRPAARPSRRRHGLAFVLAVTALIVLTHPPLSAPQRTAGTGPPAPRPAAATDASGHGLVVQNQSRQTLLVSPWQGAPAVAVPCGTSRQFVGPPAMPWQPSARTGAGRRLDVPRIDAQTAVGQQGRGTLILRSDGDVETRPAPPVAGGCRPPSGIRGTITTCAAGQCVPLRRILLNVADQRSGLIVGVAAVDFDGHYRVGLAPGSYRLALSTYVINGCFPTCAGVRGFVSVQPVSVRVPARGLVPLSLHLRPGPVTSPYPG